MDRRTFLKSIGAATLGTGAGLAYLISQIKSPSEVAESFENTAYANPIGIESRLVVPNAKQCLLLLRQHHVPFAKKQREDLVEELKNPVRRAYWTHLFELINNNQRDIAGLIKYAAKTYEGVQFFTEGVVGTYSQKDAANYYAIAMTFLKTQKVFDDATSEESTMYVPGAVPLFAKDNAFTFRGTETARGKAVTAKLMAEKGLHLTEEELNASSTVREEDALSIIAETKAPVAVLVYGGNHNSPISKPEPFRFLQRVKEWNAREEQRKISFVSVTPRAYEENDPTIQILK